MTTARFRLLATALTATVLAAAPGGLRAQDRGIAALFDQASYWRLQSRPEQALRTYERILTIDPQNVDALKGAAELQAEMGNRAAADQLLARLRQSTAPSDPRLGEASLSVRASTIDQGALAEARRLAQNGQATHAVLAYQRLFGGPNPPDSYALEYYQTLAGVPGQQEVALRGLARINQRAPQDSRSALAYARTLTYNEATRREGIERLRQLALQPETAQSAAAAWREALGWTGASPETVPLFEAYLQRNPNDQFIRRKLEEARNPPPGQRDVVGEGRQRGFEELNANRVADAGREFEAVLADNPNDPDAMGGLGLVRLRQGRTAEARQLLSRAIALDPAEGRRKWGRALDGMNAAGEVQSLRTMVLRGELDRAEGQLERLVRRDTGERADAEALLGDIALRRNDPVTAEQRYRAALARRPNLPTALAGLYDALQQQGRFAEAEQLAARSGSAVASAAGSQRAEALRAEAARSDDPAAALALLRGAQASAPDNPWIALDLARALARNGQAAEARGVMEGPVTGQAATREQLYAAALFANEDSRPQDAARFIERIPDRVRTPDATRLLRSVRLSEQVASAAEPARWGRPDVARARLMQLVARPDPSGEMPAQVVRMFNTLGDRTGAAEAARVAASVNRSAPPAGRIALASAMLDAGLETESMAIAQGLASDGRLSADERRQVAQLQTGMAIRAADRLNAAGNQAAAYDRLVPALASDPTNAAANLALARLYQGAQEPRDAQRIAEAVLQRDPRNIDARGAAIEAAAALRDWRRAEALLAEARAMSPNDPRVTMLEARLARAQGDGRRARQALELAARQRRDQLGGEAVAVGLPGSAQYAAQPANAPGVYDNPFRRTPLAGTAQTAPVGYAPYGQQAVQANAGFQPSLQPVDPMLSEINRQLVEVREESASRLTAGASFRTRSGDGGLGRLNEFGATVEGSTPVPGIGGRIALRASPVTIDAGSIGQSNAALRQFGSNPLVLGGTSTSVTSATAAAIAPKETSASGMALGLAYLRPNFSLDIGSTPLGFQETNILGGIEVAPQLAPGLRLRLTAERRAVTDSLLSWSGMHDTSTGRSWGGVTRTGGRAQFEYTAGATNFYAGGGYAILEGSGVANNSRIEGSAGLAHTLYQTPDDELVTGLDLTYLSYAKNLRYFTLGHGGYFSPQSFVALSVPLDYRARSGAMTYRVGGTVGLANWQEDSAKIFPNDRGLQSELETAATSDSTIATSYAGQSKSGVSAGLRGDVEYALTERLRLGALLRYDRSADWNELRGMVFARYRFDQ